MVVEKSILINAGLEKVWNTFTDLTCWREWNTVIRDVSSDEACISSGCRLFCNFRPFHFPLNVRIEIKDVKPGKSISWYAKKLGLAAEHLFDFQATEKGVLVTSRETFWGVHCEECLFSRPEAENTRAYAGFPE